MKGMDILCASQAATSICLSMEPPQPSSSSSSSSLLLGRAIDRYNPIIRDSTRIAKQPLSTPHPPITPHKNPNKKKKNHKNPLKENEQKIKNNISKKPNDDKIKNSNNEGTVRSRKSWSCTKPGDFISPPGSTRYLLGDKVFNYNALSEFDPAVNAETSKPKDLKNDGPLFDVKPTPSSLPDQVVVLRVSLHCRGCEKKMRKHISRMEGVTSFNVDFMAKKVTVVGNVTPNDVLSSISKVKNAQLWSPTIASSVQPLNLTKPEIKNDDYKGVSA